MSPRVLIPPLRTSGDVVTAVRRVLNASMLAADKNVLLYGLQLALAAMRQRDTRKDGYDRPEN